MDKRTEIVVTTPLHGVIKEKDVNSDLIIVTFNCRNTYWTRIRPDYKVAVRGNPRLPIPDEL